MNQLKQASKPKKLRQFATSTDQVTDQLTKMKCGATGIAK